MITHSDRVATDYREIPIPVRHAAPTTRDYHGVRVDLDNPLAAEELLPLVTLGLAAEGYYSRADGTNPPYYRPFSSSLPTVYSRRTIAQKLLEVNTRLRPFGVEVFVWDGYRSLLCQHELWSFLFRRARTINPQASDAELLRHVAEYCSDPRDFNPQDPQTWPTHITGGAVDLTLRRLRTGEHLFMGGIFDDPAPLSHTAAFEALPESDMTASALEARRNRRLLYWSMLASDFVNYSFEWWHFDWGTQMWIANRQGGEGPNCAVYGPANYSPHF